MHQNRRKKKRVNYGVRAVEVIRGAKGFGFTISGQQPCILSCIVQGSPAEGAGLRAGDYLVAVNGHNVSKVPHDDVVQLIGSSKGVLRLQIAENYYSDSSDEEGLATVRSKPKYAHKPRAANASALQLQCRAAKVVRDLQSGAMFHMVPAGLAAPDSKDQYNYSSLHYRWNMTSPLPPPPPPVSHKRDSEKIVHRTVVGYLGTIDIPNQLHPSSMMQVLRKCIKRLKAEKRNPTTVLLTIHVANIKLTNSENRVIAEYPSYRIIFCNSFSEQDKQYFGILTKSMKNTDDIVSNSCHVFTIYYKLIDHEVHSSACNVFGFTCTKSSELNVCQEFPDSCTSLIGAIQTLYISDCTNGEANPYNEARVRLDTASPQPSNISTSTAHSSNSDSGIGFKDDYGSCSGKNTANDCERTRQCSSNMQYRNVSARLSRESVNEAAGHRLTVRAISEARLWNKELKFDPSKEMRHVTGSGEGTTTTCAGTSAPAASARTMLASTSVGSLASVCTTALLDGIKDAAESSSKAASTEGLKRLMDTTNKLSPKVYCGQVTKSLVHSLEDINSSMEYARPPYCHSYSGKPDKPRPWGSLQEIRNFRSSVSDNCIYGSTESCDKNNDCKGVHTWANGFEKLLEDPKGLQTFAEFLKKEFSHENIYFWAACERYKDTKDAAMRRRLACQIYQRHLSSTAAEPVNVDSHASGQITQDLLDEAPADLFLQAQKQVFNLMKFDSYPRFLRSELYRACLEAGSAIVNTEDCDLHLTSSPSVKLKKSHSDAEDRCRKSILPWNRKNRSKSKDRGESEYNKAPSRSETIYKSFTVIKRETEGNNNEDSVSISSSRSSLASWDLALRQSFNKHSVSSYDGQTNEKKDARSKCTGLCRVILPDGSTTVVTTSQTESIKDVVTRLLDKRALRYSNYDVLILATDEMVDTKCFSSVLAGQEVEVVLTKVLKVELPSRRIISVIAHKGKTLKEVLRPLLNKYGFNLDLISIWSEGHCVPMDIMAINAPTRIIVAANEEEPGSFTSNGSMIVVSNRLPFVLKRNEITGQLERKASAGGLVTAVAPVVISGNGVWVGWPGMHMENPNEPIPESDPNDRTPTAGLLSRKVVAVHVDPGIFDSYYNGCCNGTFWPLFHSMPDRATFIADHWRAYTAVNQQFAAKTVAALEQIHKEQKNQQNGTPLVWVHDYHLMLAANWIRQAAEEKNLRLKLGFFLHIPFPPWDIFRLFPWADEILQGMLGCDMVGFHIQDYCLNFVDCCQRCLGCRVDRKNLLVEHGGRTVRVRPLPIGIPFDRFVSLAENAIKVMQSNQKIVLGVDRLDYTKGLVHRLKAFEMLLEKHPEHREQVTMLQIAVPSRTDVREYQDLKLEMDQLIGCINGRFTTPNWSPIRYIYGCVSQDELAAFYREAAVALVTPLRDGMNLVAKEFVACQINTPPGVLVVSPFAGAGEMMHEALICNPYEIDEAAEVIHRALTMPEDERTLRMNHLRRRERIYDVNYWMKSFLQVMGSLEEHDSVGATTMQPVTMDDFDDYLSKYIGDNHKLALLLDYDGTLAPIATHPDLAILPLETKNVLQRLSNMSDVYIAIISGRNVDNVKSMVGIEGITYAGNHGLEILHPDGSKFVHPMPAELEDKVASLMQTLQEQLCRDGAWVENKGALLTFHYRETPMEGRPKMVDQAKRLIEGAGFKACAAHCAIEARPPVEWNKGRASIYILRTAFGLDWSERIRIIYAGDDVTDEDAMKALKGMAATFRVASSHIIRTSAERRLPSTDSVLTMLKWVERHLSRRKPRNSIDIPGLPSRFRRSSGGVTMEMSYTPPRTPLES